MDHPQTREPSTDDIAAARPAAATEAPAAAREAPAPAPDAAGATEPAETTPAPGDPSRSAEAASPPGEAASQAPPGAGTQPPAPPGSTRLEPAAQPGGSTEAAASDTAQDARQTGQETSPGDTPLLPDDQGDRLRGRWREVQTRFVDDPRDAVAAADGLVAELMQTLASGFAERRRALEEQWQRGEDVGTEQLRVVLQQYRAFFDRLLSA
jgi:hypothetical protein